MADLLLYSTNPFIAHEICRDYRSGKHVVWCSDYYDPSSAAAGSPGAAIAPSSSPKSLYDLLGAEVKGEDEHSATIKRYRGTFIRLAREWYSDGSITKDDMDEIISKVRSKSWRIWRPVLFLIPRQKIVDEGRLTHVPRNKRASHGPEMRILDLGIDEFEMIEY